MLENADVTTRPLHRSFVRGFFWVSMVILLIASLTGCGIITDVGEGTKGPSLVPAPTAPPAPPLVFRLRLLVQPRLTLIRMHSSLLSRASLTATRWLLQLPISCQPPTNQGMSM